MTECRFPFDFAGDDGVTRDPASPKNRELYAKLMQGEHTLKAGRSPEYTAFLKRLMCVDPKTRYCAKEALKDEWIMAGSRPWTAADVDSIVAGLPAPGTSPLPRIPDSELVRTQSKLDQWVLHVQKIIQHKLRPPSEPLQSAHAEPIVAVHEDGGGDDPEPETELIRSRHRLVSDADDGFEPATREPAVGAKPACEWIWSWVADSRQERAYPDEICVKLERARASDDENEVPVDDAGTYVVDLKNMCQRRTDNPLRCRRVTRKRRGQKANERLMVTIEDRGKIGLEFGVKWATWPHSLKVTPDSPAAAHRQLHLSPKVVAVKDSAGRLQSTENLPAEEGKRMIKEAGRPLTLAFEYPAAPQIAVEAVHRTPQAVTVDWLRTAGSGPLMEGWLDMEETGKVYSTWAEHFFMLWPKVKLPPYPS